MSDELEQRVIRLEAAVKRMKAALREARVIKTGAATNRNYPPDDYFVHMPSIKDSPEPGDDD